MIMMIVMIVMAGMRGHIPRAGTPSGREEQTHGGTAAWNCRELRWHGHPLRYQGKGIRETMSTEIFRGYLSQRWLTFKMRSSVAANLVSLRGLS